MSSFLNVCLNKDVLEEVIKELNARMKVLEHLVEMMENFMGFFSLN